MKPKIFKTHHIAIKVKNLNKAVLFYKNVLGLKTLIKNKDKNNKLRSVWFDLNKTILMIEKASKAELSSRKNFLLAFEIKKSARKKWLNHLIKLKIKIYKHTQFSIYFNDPENNKLALSHFPKK